MAEWGGAMSVTRLQIGILVILVAVFFAKEGLNKKREEGSSAMRQSIGKLIIHDTTGPYELNSCIEFEKAKFMAKVKKE